MSRTGPPPLPTKVKERRGNPGKRTLNKREPKPRVDAPRCPAWLNAEAKKAWKRLVPKLTRMGVLTEVDGDALSGYVQAYARWKEAEEFLDKHGTVYPLRDDRGRVKYMQQFPQVSIVRNLQQVLRAYQQEFGLTPSARTRIHTEPSGDEPSEFERFLRGRSA